MEAGAPGEDVADFLAALRVRNVEVATAGTVSQPFFEPTGWRILADGRSLQVYQYPATGNAREAASTISPDGNTIGETTVDWIGPPHWYQHGRLLVLYVGSDPNLRQVLEDVLGHQVAGALPH